MNRINILAIGSRGSAAASSTVIPWPAAQSLAKSGSLSLEWMTSRSRSTQACLTGLQNQDDGYYQLNWKTLKTYANSRKTLKLVPMILGGYGVWAMARRFCTY